MRRPNGNGTVVKLSGKRRKPYCAKVTVGWDYDEEKDKLSQIQKPLGTFSTYEEADRVRASYVYDPYDIDIAKITFLELYKMWEHENEHDKRAKKYYATPFNKLKHIYNTPFRELKVARIQNIINETCSTESTRAQMKSLFNLLTNYAAFIEVVDINKCNLIDINKGLEKKTSGTETDKYTPYSLSEIRMLRTCNDDVAASLLLMIYTGMRIDKEFLALNRSDIDYENHVIFIKDSKTGAGIRYIFISKYAEPLLHQLYDEHVYAFREGLEKKYAYNKYMEKKYNPFKEEHELDHIPYDCRHTFSSLSHRSGMDELTRKRVFGHSIKDFTNRVYTMTEYQDLMVARDCFDSYMDKILDENYVEPENKDIKIV